MNTPITLQVKAYMLPETVKPTAATISMASEIRRFVLVHPWAGSYAELMQKVVQSFGALISSQDATALSLYWQDDEGELVGFSSDDEMKYANDLLVTLQASRNAPLMPYVFKIYIGRKSAAKAPAPTVNYGVNCDGCNASDFVGLRFKCEVCPDYDLCSTCEASGVHKETGHALAKIDGGHPRCGRGRGPFNGGFFGPRGGCTRRRGPHHHEQQPQAAPNMFADLGAFLPIVNNPAELQRLGQHLKSMLEPFGVDVDYFVDQLPKTNEAKKEEAAKPSSEQAGPSTPQAPAPTAASASAETAASSDVPMEEPKEAAAATETETPKVDPKVENPFLQVINMMKNFNGVQNGASTSAAASSAPPAATEDSFVTLDTEMEKELKIIRAIEQLKQMGYTDDNGWLMRLVVAKEGNINAVLDAIAPK